MNKSKLIIVLLTCIFLLEIIVIYRNNAIPSFSVKSTTKSEIKDELIIALFMNNIIADSNKFYDNYFSDGLEYFNYEFKIKDISKQLGNIYITFETTPMIGAHNSVGDDEITYKVDVFGNKTLEKFIHKKSYVIPPWLQNYMIKPYPETKN